MKLFVYGTLKRGFRLYQGIETGVSEGTVKGDLFSLGSFPAIKLGGDNIVYGEVHEVDDKFLPLFDMIEGEGYLYKRKEIQTEEGVDCWIYEYINEDDLKLPIESGVWEVLTHE